MSDAPAETTEPAPAETEAPAETAPETPAPRIAPTASIPVSEVTPPDVIGPSQDVLIANPEGADQYGRPPGLPIEDPNLAPADWPYLSVASVVPGLGPVAGGEEVTVNGSWFAEDSTVSFGANEATAVTYVSDRVLTCTVPAATDQTEDSTVDVTVTGSAEADPVETATLPNGYAYEAPEEEEAEEPATEEPAPTEASTTTEPLTLDTPAETPPSA